MQVRVNSINKFLIDPHAESSITPKLTSNTGMHPGLDRLGPVGVSNVNTVEPHHITRLVIPRNRI